MTLGSTRPRRRWLRNSVIAVLVMANLVIFGGLLFINNLENDLVRTATTDPEVVAELVERPRSNAEPVTFLVIGSDSREGLDDLTNFGRFEGARADVVMLIKVYPDQDRAQLLSIPRDLYVEIPGHGKDRINAAYAFGGASLMVKTVRQATGLPVHHYVEVDFLGFKAIVDEVGGITMEFPYPARDLKSGLQVEAGRQVLDGEMALAYARSRQYQELRGGEWVEAEANDFGRTQRQQEVILALLAALRRPSTLTEAGSIVHGFASHLTIDSALAESSIIELAFSLRGIRGNSIERATLPGDTETVGEASVVIAKEPEAGEMISAFASGAPMNPTAAGPLRLQVLNGNGVEGAAGKLSEVLSRAGFEIASVGDADRKDFAETTIIVPADAVDRGQIIADALGFGTITTGRVADAYDAVVIVGSDAA